MIKVETFEKKLERLHKSGRKTYVCKQDVLRIISDHISRDWTYAKTKDVLSDVYAEVYVMPEKEDYDRCYSVGYENGRREEHDRVINILNSHFKPK